MWASKPLNNGCISSARRSVGRSGRGAGWAETCAAWGHAPPTSREGWEWAADEEGSSGDAGRRVPTGSGVPPAAVRAYVQWAAAESPASGEVQLAHPDCDSPGTGPPLE